MDSSPRQASPSFTISWSLLKLLSTELVMPSNHLILCCPILLPSIFPSISIFFNESALHIRWPEYWSFSFSIRHSNEYSRLISFRMDWLDLLAVQGTLKRLLQLHSLKASGVSLAPRLFSRACGLGGGGETTSCNPGPPLCSAQATPSPASSRTA